MDNEFITTVLYTKQGFKMYPEPDKDAFLKFCRENATLVGEVVFTVGIIKERRPKPSARLDALFPRKEADENTGYK